MFTHYKNTNSHYLLLNISLVTLHNNKISLIFFEEHMFVTKSSSNGPQLYPFLSKENSYLPPHYIPQQHAMENLYWHLSFHMILRITDCKVSMLSSFNMSEVYELMLCADFITFLWIMNSSSSSTVSPISLIKTNVGRKIHRLLLRVSV